MANKRETHHSRYSSLPNVSLVALEPLLSGGTTNQSQNTNADEKQTSSNPQSTNTDKVTVTPLKKVPSKRKNMHKKSSSLHMSAIKQQLQAPISNEVLSKPTAHTYNLSANMIQNLTKYSKKDQEDLISIQSRLRKWIGSDKFVTLDKFIDLMDTIAPHVSVPQSTNMFNQMDPSNNGQIETALLLHDEFLPRMILNLFAVHSRTNSMSSLPDDFNLEGSDSDSDNYDEMDNKDLIRTIKSYKNECKRLKQWIIEQGQPALEKCEELQMMLDIYDAERTDKQYELQSFKTRLSKMGDLEQQLNQTQSHTMLLQKDNDVLLLSVNESVKKQEIEHNKYNEIVREAAEYKKLAKELQEINDRHTKKNQSLQDKQNRFGEENQNLRQLLLEYETENTKLTEWQQMMEYKQQMDEYKNETQMQGSVRFMSDDENNKDEFRRHRQRRMTLKNDDNQMENDDTFDANYNLDSELQNTGGVKGRSRRNTIRQYYELQQRRLSYMSLPNEDQLKESDEDQLTSDTQLIERQDSVLSFVSTMSRPTHAYDNDNALYKTQKNIFENALTEEYRMEIRQTIEQEFDEDYSLKLRQKDIELQLKLNEEKTLLEEEHRKYKEFTQSKMDELKNKLIEYRKNGKELITLADNLSFDADECVYLSSNNISEYSNISDDEKDVFDNNMDYDNENINSINIPLLDKHKKNDSDYVEMVLNNDENKRKKKKKKKKKRRVNSDQTDIVQGDGSNGKCFSCFGLFNAGNTV